MTVAIVLVISNAITPAAAQAQKEKEAEQRQELEKKTLALLNEIASGAWGLKLPENRVFIMSNVADLLWTFDEKRARALYWDALNSITSINPTVPATTENLSKAERDKLTQAYYSIFRLRQTLLRHVANRDAQLALDMLRATRQVASGKFASEFSFADERQLEQEIASVVAARDPAQALQVARQSLAKGLTFELLNLLYQLNEKDSEKASQFAGDIITKVQATNLATDYRAAIIGVSLLENSRTRDEKVLANGTAVRTKVLSINDEQKRDLVEVLTNTALSASANSNLLFYMSEVMPEIRQFFPERRALLERKLAAFNDTLTRQQRDENGYNTLIRGNKPEELVRSVATANDEIRLNMYNQAAIMAVAQGKTDEFRDFVSKEVTNGEDRKKILDSLDGEEISAAAGRKQLDELRKLLPKIRRKEERARAMAELAIMLKEKGEDEEASTLLDEAATLIKSDLNDDKQTNVLLTLLCAYAIVDPPKAFALAERTVDQANRQISLLMLVDKVVKSGAVKKNEIILDQAGILPLDFLLF